MDSKLKIGLNGHSSAMTSLSATIIQQPDWCVVGVFGGSALTDFAKTQNIPIANSMSELASSSDVIVNENSESSQITLLRNGPHNQHQEKLDLRNPNLPRTINLPHRNVVAIRRLTIELAKALTVDNAINRLSATVVRPFASDYRQVDGLRPGIDDGAINQQLSNNLKTVVQSATIRTVSAPINETEILMMHWSLRNPVSCNDVLQRLSAAPRLMIGLSSDGFLSTADISEYFRDSIRPRGDQWEVFCWQDSIVIEKNNLYLMASHSSVAVLVPEIMDSISHLSSDPGEPKHVETSTDHRLGLREPKRIFNVC